jgi:hypothetical protein
VFTCIKNKEKEGFYDINLSFSATVDMEQVDIISDGKCVCSIKDVPKDFSYSGTLRGKGYFRVRGWGKPVNRKYSEGQFCPQFLINPIFCRILLYPSTIVQSSFIIAESVFFIEIAPMRMPATNITASIYILEFSNLSLIKRPL